MLQFSKVLASLCAGCLCTLTIHQIPALGNVLLPQTHAIPETSPIRPVDVMPLEPLPTPAETAPAMSIPPTETQSPQTQTTAAVATAVTVLTATATTTIPPETTAATESETTVAVTSTIPESDPFFQEHETWFKAYMDYRTITNTDSVQYAMEQNAWTDDRGLRRMADDYLVAMGQAGWKAAAVSGLPLRWKTAANLPFGWAISKQTSTQTKRTAIAAAKAVQMFWNSL